MLPSMPLISTPYKDDSSGPSSELSKIDTSASSVSSHHYSSSASLTSETNRSELQISSEIDHLGNLSSKALDLSNIPNVSSKKSSPLKHVTPILKKYNSHRKGKGNKKISFVTKGVAIDQPQQQQQPLPPPPPPQPLTQPQQQQQQHPPPQPLPLPQPPPPQQPPPSQQQQQQQQQATDRQSLRPIAPKPVVVVISPHVQEEKCSDGVKTVEIKENVSASNKTTNVTTDVSESKKNSTNEENVERKDNEDELAALMLASTTIRSTKARTSNVVKKKSKQMREMESAVALLTPDLPAVREEKCYAFAHAYFMKVKERLDGTGLYEEFLHSMNEFGTSILEVSDLYKKITVVLNGHPDLCEEFLAFLLPQQAMQCGKFMEYLMITKMKDFFSKLEINFEKQPQQMQKIYTHLSQLSSQKNVNVTDVRGAILPLLKGNSLLIDYFLALLPLERPPESLMTDFEDMDFGDVDNEHVGEEDQFETMVVPDQQDAYGGDSCACNCHDARDDKFRIRAAHCVSCGTRFIHGKVFLQTGKVLRPAKVVFSAENSNDSINRLSAKTRPKGKNRRKAATHTEAPNNSKDNSPAKQIHVSVGGDPRVELNENGGADNLLLKCNTKSSSPKNARMSKAKTSSTHKGREKANNRGSVKEQKHSNHARPSRITCNKQNVLPSKHVASIHNITPNINNSSCITVPKISNRNSNVPSFSALHVRRITAIHTVPTPPVSDSALCVTPKISSHISENLILTIPSINTDQLNRASSTPIAGDQGATLSEIVHDESAILPPDSAAMDSNIKDFSTISHVLQSDVIHGRRDSSCDSMDACDSVDATERSEEAMSLDRSDKANPSQELENGTVAKDAMEVVSDCKDSSDASSAQNDVDMSEPDDMPSQEQPTSDVTVEQLSEPCSQSKAQQTPSGEMGTSDTTTASWTREEDKIILQMFQMDCGMEQTFIKISEQLPLRTLNEIRSRFQILMNLLKQMTGAKMEEGSSKGTQ